MKLNNLIHAIIFGLALHPFCTSAQNPWLNNNKPGFISLEFLKPSLKGGNDGITTFSAVYDISGGLALSDKSEIIFDLPIAHAKLNGAFIDQSETTIGNIYLSLRTGDRSKALRGEFGVVLPTTSTDKLLAQSIGVFSMPNMSEKFSADTWAISAKLISEKLINEDKGVYYRIRGGLMYANDRMYDVAGVNLDITGQLGVRMSSGVSVFGGINGRATIYDNAESSGDDDKNSFFFGLGASYKGKNFEPGLTLNLPLDDPYKYFINNIIGVSLLFHLDQ